MWNPYIETGKKARRYIKHTGDYWLFAWAVSASRSTFGLALSLVVSFEAVMAAALELPSCSRACRSSSVSVLER